MSTNQATMESTAGALGADLTTSINYTGRRMQGSKLKPSLCTIAILLLLWNLPAPSGLSVQAWHLFAIFATVIFAIIAKPLPMGALAILALAICTVTQTLTIEQALVGYGYKIIWLVLIAFLLAKGFIKTGLGKRIAYIFVYYLGKNTLGLGYGLMCTELILAPFVPSNTARGAGVIFPIVTALNKEYASDPKDGTANKIGAFLIKVAFHANLVTSAMFLTAMAANPLIVSFAAQFDVQITWLAWAKAAIVPGLINLMLLPIIIYKLSPPKLKHTPEARQFAKEQIHKMGPLSTAEWVMVGTFAMLIAMWIFGEMLNVDATVVAFLGLSVLLVTGVLTWDDILSEQNAWNTFIWLATLLTITNFLAKFGFMQWFGNYIQGGISGYSWLAAVLISVLVYFYSHYLFASLSAHVSSMYVPFVIVAVTVGAPVTLVVFLLAFLSSLSAAITHYGTGTSPVYFGAGYLSVSNWWRIGGLVGTFNLLIWITVGSLWWKIIGIW